MNIYLITFLHNSLSPCSPCSHAFLSICPQFHYICTRKNIGILIPHYFLTKVIFIYSASLYFLFHLKIYVKIFLFQAIETFVNLFESYKFSTVWMYIILLNPFNLFGLATLPLQRRLQRIVLMQVQLYDKFSEAKFFS